MVAQTQTSSSARPPPDVPNDPKLSTQTSQYLRNFALWCRHGFQDSLRNQEALPGIMLRGFDTQGGSPNVYMLEVDNAGVAYLAPMALGSGTMGAPVPIGSGEFLPMEGGTLTGFLGVPGSIFITADDAAGGNAFVGFFDENSARQGYVGWVGGAISLRNDQTGASIDLDADGYMRFSAAIADQVNFYVSGAISQNGPGLHYLIAQPGNDAFISFVVPDAFGLNVGLNANGNFYRGGWSDGPNYYNFWTSRELPNPTCDYRIKEGVKPLASTWNQVKKLRPVSYRQKSFHAKSGGRPVVEADSRERWGLIAHELQEDLLETAATGKKDDELLQAPNMNAVVAALTRTVQELQARVEALEAAR
jgi:hypothetical protein